ncbi:MAG: hypothetical protein J2P21_05000 [Chloracidobacterium sp.]|nr:hypothetical protein [Chloracidobacterium sp.]
MKSEGPFDLLAGGLDLHLPDALLHFGLAPVVGFFGFDSVTSALLRCPQLSLSDTHFDMRARLVDPPLTSSPP